MKEVDLTNEQERTEFVLYDAERLQRIKNLDISSAPGTLRVPDNGSVKVTLGADTPDKSLYDPPILEKMRQRALYAIRQELVAMGASKVADQIAPPRATKGKR